MYETGERKPKHSLREEDQGVGYEGEEESMEDRMGYYGKGTHTHAILLRSPRAPARPCAECTHTHTHARTGARKGFATMPKERVREIASKGGRHSHGFKHKAKYVPYARKMRAWLS
jgi:hypothetical protein